MVLNYERSKKIENIKLDQKIKNSQGTFKQNTLYVKKLQKFGVSIGENGLHEITYFIKIFFIYYIIFLTLKTIFVARIHHQVKLIKI